MIARAAHRRHEIEERPAGKVGGTGQLARQIAHRALYAGPIGKAIAPADEHPPRRGPHEPHEQAHGDGLPRPVRTEKAHHLAAGDGKGHLEHPAPAPVVLRRPLQLDDRFHCASLLLRYSDTTPRYAVDLFWEGSYGKSLEARDSRGGPRDPRPESPEMASAYTGRVILMTYRQITMA